MFYVIYQNDPTEKLRIHEGTCAYAKKPGHRTKNGEWHGPYGSLQQAKAAQTILVGQVGWTPKIIDTCDHCI